MSDTNEEIKTQWNATKLHITGYVLFSPTNWVAYGILEDVPWNIPYEPHLGSDYRLRDSF